MTIQTFNRSVKTIVLFAILGWAQTLTGSLFAQSDQKMQTEPIDIKQLSWIAGHWTGEGLGGKFEETWNPPLAGEMMGMFKLVQEGKVNVYEIMTIVPKEDSLVLRIKHFSAAFEGWEEKDGFVEFPFVKVEQNAIHFDGMVFERINENEMHITVRIKEGETEPQELKFVFHRVKK